MNPTRSCAPAASCRQLAWLSSVKTVKSETTAQDAHPLQTIKLTRLIRRVIEGRSMLRLRDGHVLTTSYQVTAAARNEAGRMDARRAARMRPGSDRGAI